MMVSPCSDRGGSVCRVLRLLFLHGIFTTLRGKAFSVISMAWLDASTLILPVLHNSSALFCFQETLCVLKQYRDDWSIHSKSSLDAVTNTWPFTVQKPDNWRYTAEQSLSLCWSMEHSLLQLTYAQASHDVLIALTSPLSSWFTCQILYTYRFVYFMFTYKCCSFHQFSRKS